MCANHVIFDLDLDLEHTLYAGSSGDHHVQVWWRSSHFCGRRSDLRKMFTDGQTDRRTDDGRRKTRGRVRAGPRVRGKTSALGKPDGDLFIARTDMRHDLPPTSQPASQSDSTQLKAGNCISSWSELKIKIHPQSSAQWYI